jgi:hypothetical protein
MECHTCGGKGHFKRDCPNKKIMIVNEDTNEYETGDDADPDGSDDDYFCHDGVDAYPSTANKIVCSQVCSLCLLHLKVSGAICSKLKHLLDQTKLANSSSMVIVAATLLTRSCVQS